MQTLPWADRFGIKPDELSTLRDMAVIGDALVERQASS